MKQISIIMPCYNAEQIIDNTINDLVNQTIGIDNMELIFVDDASTDGTLDKLCEWEKRYPQSVLVVHCEENGRQGRARNIGLSYATSKYVGFMDNDDRICVDMYEQMLAQAEKFDSDLVIAGSGKVTLEEFEKLNISAKEEKPVTFYEITDAASRRAFLETDYNIAIWNKIYRRDMLLENHLVFLEGMIYDDIYFSGLMKMCPEKVVVMPNVFYYHILTGNNASYSNKDKKLVFGYIEAQLELINELQNRGQYEAFKDFYKREFLMSYQGFVRAYSLQFGYIEVELWNNLRECIFRLMPDILECPVLNFPFQKKSAGIIFDSLRKPVDGKYILKLVGILMEERVVV